MSNRSGKINSILSKKNFERTDFPMVPEVTRGYQTTEIQKAFKGNEIANDIVESLKRKTVMKDIEKNRILALSDDHVTELDEKDIRIIANRALAQVNEFVTLVANKGWNKNYVKSILVGLESIHAAFIDVPTFNRAKKGLNELLRNGMENGSDDDRLQIKKGIEEFFHESYKSIAKEKIQFKNIPYSLKNTEEKEYLRNEFIYEMFEAGVMDYEFLAQNGIISNLDFITFEELYRKGGRLTPAQVENAYYLADIFDTREEMLEYFAKKDKRYFSQFATLEDVVEFLDQEKIDLKTVQKRFNKDTIKELSPEMLESLFMQGSFPRTTDFVEYVSVKNGTEKYITKKALEGLSREALLKVVLSDKIKYKISLESQDYIDMFGKLNIDDILLLESSGKVNPEDVIKITKFSSIKIENPEEYEHVSKKVLDFYNADKLGELASGEKINLRFAEIFNDFIQNDFSENERKEYFKKLSEELSQKEDAENIVIKLSNAGINLSELDYTISVDTISDMYLDDIVDEKNVIDMYNQGLIEPSVIRELFDDNEIRELFNSGRLDYRILKLLDNRQDVIRMALVTGILATDELMRLYSDKDGLSPEEFLGIIKDYDFGDERIVEYITDDITPEKIEELFKNYYISQDDLSELVSRGLISQKEAKEFAERIATDEEYESIFNDVHGFIVLTEDTPEGESVVQPVYRGEGSKRASQIKIDPELQELLLEDVGFDLRRPILQGANNSLNGYRLYPSKEHGLMVFLNGNKAGNATYIMTLQQGMYFIKKIVRDGLLRQEKGDEVIVESDATKQALRETEHVKVKNASAGWGKNVVDAMKALSPSFKEKLSEDKEYKNDIEDVIAEIRADYKKRLEDSGVEL